MPQLGDVYKENETGELATVIHLANFSGLYTLQKTSGHIIAIPYMMLVGRWTKQ